MGRHFRPKRDMRRGCLSGQEGDCLNERLEWAIQKNWTAGVAVTLIFILSDHYSMAVAVSVGILVWNSVLHGILIVLEKRSRE